MAVKKSAEELAVEKALADYQAASDALAATGTPAPNVTPSTNTGEVKTYEEAKAALAAMGDLSKFPTLNNLVNSIQSLVPKTEALSTTLSTMATKAGVSIDADGKVVLVTVKTSRYVGSGKDRVRIDTMSDGSERQFADPDPNFIPTPTGTKDVDVLKAVLKGRGLPATLVDSSATFLGALKKEGLDNDSIVEIYLNNKDFVTKDGTTLTSPFYNTYGFYNEKVTDKYTAAELYQTVEGYKSSAAKYNLDPKFTSTDYIQKYLSNKMSVARFDSQANQARLFAVTSDPDRVKALQDLGYINTSQDLTDFYMDSNVGAEKMQQNVNTAAMAIEAIKRSNAATGIKVDTEAIKKYGAELTAKGLSEAQISALASQGYQAIAATLAPETKLSGIYEGKTAAEAATIQSELEKEQLLGLESERRKRLAEQEQMAFRAQSGTIAAGRLTGGSLATTSSLIGGV